MATVTRFAPISNRSRSVDIIRQQLDELDKRTNEEWLSTLCRRKLEELEFHDKDRATDLSAAEKEELHANRKYYSVNKCGEFVEDRLKELVPGKVFLDYACGNGHESMIAARNGASLAIGLDISHVSIQNARRRAEADGLTENTYFVQGDCENTGLPDESVDVVLCSGMLHHLNLSYAFPELRRILRPDGVILAIEALDNNPIIKLYRLLTPKMRTNWEKHHILSYRDLTFASRFFEVRSIRHWNLFTLLAVPFRDTAMFAPILSVLQAVDRVVLSIPFIRQMSWMFTFELVKKAEE